MLEYIEYIEYIQKDSLILDAKKQICLTWAKKCAPLDFEKKGQFCRSKGAGAFHSAGQSKEG